ncbi:MAG: 5'-nucleotidase C-terminal domain-containing protein [Acidobacteriota bacterium]
MLIGIAAILLFAGPPDAPDVQRHWLDPPGRRAILSGWNRTLAAQQEEAGSPRVTAPLTILQLNDVYSITPIDGAGGLARVATLKQRLTAAGRTPFMMLAGDFLSSSVESTVFKGEQMIAALNAAGLDMATLGNHEFDFGIDVLLQRMAEARFQWVISNVIDTATGQPIGGAAPYVVRTFGSLKVGFIGLCLTAGTVTPDKLNRIRLVDAVEAAGTYLPALKSAGVDVIVALTHLTFDEDRRLAERFPEIDLIVGGHEHFPITAIENRTLISKAGSDAKFVARIDLGRRSTGTTERFYELIPITGAITDEPRTAVVVNSYMSRMGAELDAVVGASRVPLEGRALRLRASETNLGDLIADAIRADAGADLAILNSGAIRGDRLHQAGPLTRRTLLELHPFGNIVCKVEVTGRIVLEALNSGVSKLPAAAGQFPQVSGLTMGVDPSAPVGQRVRDVRINGRPLELDRIYTVAIPDFVLSGGDEYSVFSGQRVLVSPEAGNLLVTAIEKYLKTAGEVAPAVEGRITIGR